MDKLIDEFQFFRAYHAFLGHQKYLEVRQMLIDRGYIFYRIE